MLAHPSILRLDKAGQPVEWLNWQDAVSVFCLGRIAWSLGDERIVVRGGKSGLSGEQSRVELPSIIAVDGAISSRAPHTRNRVPRISNAVMFRRDQHFCAYCGNRFGHEILTRDHIVPQSRLGPSSWENCISSCRRCNGHKAARTPEEAGMALRFAPYRPTLAEWLALKNRKTTPQQMDYLKNRFGSRSRLLA